MATTTTPVAKGIVPYWTGGTLAHSLLHGTEHASVTYKQGAPIIDDGSGLLSESTSPLSASNRTIGIAMVDASNKSPGSDIVWVPIIADFLFEITLSTVSGAHTLAAADQFTTFAVTKDTGSGRWFLDSATTVTNNVGFQVLAFRDAIGTVDARVVGRFLSGVIGTSLMAAPASGVALLVYG